MTAASKYPKQVFWSDEDEGFVAIAPDLPGCSAFGDTEIEAIAELDSAIPAWIDAAINAGNNVPAPSNPDQHNYSGKLLVRMPRSLHKDLVSAADKENVSLNQFIVYVLSMHSTLRAVQMDVYPSARGNVRVAEIGNLLSLSTSNTSIKATSSLYRTEVNTVSCVGFLSSNFTSSGTVQHVEPTTVQYVESTTWEVGLTQALENSVIRSKVLANSPLMLRTISNSRHGE